MNGTYLREKEKDFILHKDNRKVNLSNASSGQQETLPLVTVLKVLNYSSFFNGGATLYIEEPEAHLFPTAQMKW
ncbi:ATP-binding protein [Salinimicrobium terrae]|uniref:AAA family ATPase n=1 Tax=Salinimicrobium terrae TaxID=470866 RepID=UPI00040FD4FB